MKKQAILLWPAPKGGTLYVLLWIYGIECRCKDMLAAGIIAVVTVVPAKEISAAAEAAQEKQNDDPGAAAPKDSAVIAITKHGCYLLSE